ncbi:MAG TPA: MATE family efflux transporter [Solirubrobacteraceae bacterium]|nr:MATE family efflux transporter [Solirubrobacteraceae bacterium]
MDRVGPTLRRGRLTDSRELLALATPIALTQLAQVALTTIDIVMIGVLGVEALAAGGLAIVLFNQVRTMGVGLITAAGNRVAAIAAQEEPGALAADAERGIRDVMRASLLLATAAGLGGAVLMVGCAHGLTWLGQDRGIVAQAQPMLWALAPGLLPCLWFNALRQYTVGMRRPRALVWITVVCIVFNAALNAALGYGVWVFPRLELVGIGMATTLSHLLSFALLCAAVRSDRVLAPMLSLRAWRARRTTVRELTSLGVPIAATYGSEAGFFSIVALVMGGFGAAALAAHTVVNQLVYIAFQITIGLSHGASIIVSREVALGRVAAAAGVGRVALANGAAAMAVFAALYVIGPELVLKPFMDLSDPADAHAVHVATQLLAVAALLQFADCAQNIGVGLLRGLHDTKAGFRATVLGYWAVGLPLALLLGPVADLGPIGVWIGLMVGLATTAALLLKRFVGVLRDRTLAQPAACA